MESRRWVKNNDLILGWATAWTVATALVSYLIPTIPT